MKAHSGVKGKNALKKAVRVAVQGKARWQLGNSRKYIKLIYKGQYSFYRMITFLHVCSFVSFGFSI